MGKTQLLGAPKLHSGTGRTQVNAVIDVLKSWDIVDKVYAMCFDTTSSNTGSYSGASVTIE